MSTQLPAMFLKRPDAHYRPFPASNYGRQMKIKPFSSARTGFASAQKNCQPPMLNIPIQSAFPEKIFRLSAKTTAGNDFSERHAANSSHSGTGILIHSTLSERFNMLTALSEVAVQSESKG
ncbi:MAG: hypothetical protein ABIG11_10125 [bacterium]